MKGQAGSARVSACILFLRVPLHEQQGGWRERLSGIVGDALAAAHTQPSLVLEAPEGLAVVAPLAPSAARALADAALRAQGDWPLALALHHGQLQVIGAGAATRLAGDDLALAREAARVEGQCSQSDVFRAAAASVPPRRTRRALLAGAGIIALLGAGWGGRLARQRYEALHRPAVLVFDIHPSGEVLVDGELKGNTPPLERLAVTPGPHAIEVRHPRARPFHLDVQLAPGQELVVQHAFAAPPVRRGTPPQRRKPGVLDRFKFW
jgi:hypothetical protein